MDEPLTEQELAEIEARIQAASPEPWEWEVQSFAGQPSWKTSFCGPPSLWSQKHTDNEDFVLDNRCSECEPAPFREEDMVFIAHARGDMPRLLAEVKRLRGMLRFMEGSSAFQIGSAIINGAGAPEPDEAL